jgi:hypothetical protein
VSQHTEHGLRTQSSLHRSRTSWTTRNSVASGGGFSATGYELREAPTVCTSREGSGGYFVIWAFEPSGPRGEGLQLGGGSALSPRIRGAFQGGAFQTEWKLLVYAGTGSDRVWLEWKAWREVSSNRRLVPQNRTGFTPCQGLSGLGIRPSSAVTASCPSALAKSPGWLCGGREGDTVHRTSAWVYMSNPGS